MPDPILVTHDNAQHRFEIKVAGAPAFLKYTLRDGVMDLLHTEVPPEHEGQGYGGALAKAALDYARAEKLRVIPTCPFVRAYVKRHPEYAALVDGPGPKQPSS